MMRLDKYLAERTGMTRSESRKAVTKGRVSIDGAVCRKADTQLDEHTAAVALDGVPLAGAYRKFVYIMLNKPEGVVSASRDKKDTTVVDLVAADFPRRELFPAGRLDKTSTGFVLLTDDGALAHDILSPAHHVEKQYVVTLDTPLTDAMRRGFAAGVTLTDGETMAPAGVEPLTDDGLTVQVTLRQGVYHQIKRMFGVFDAGVNALHRESIGGELCKTVEHHGVAGFQLGVLFLERNHALLKLLLKLMGTGDVDDDADDNGPPVLGNIAQSPVKDPNVGPVPPEHPIGDFIAVSDGHRLID